MPAPSKSSPNSRNTEVLLPLGSVLLAPNSKYVIKIVLLLLQCSAMFLCYFVCVMFFTSFVVIFVVCLPFGRAQAAETTVKLE